MAYEFRKMNLSGTDINVKDEEARAGISEAVTKAETALANADSALTSVTAQNVAIAAVEAEVGSYNIDIVNLKAKVGTGTLETTAQNLTAAVNELNSTTTKKTDFPVFIGESPSSGASNDLTFDLTQYINVNGLYIIYGVASEVAIRLNGTVYTLIFFRYPSGNSNTPSLSGANLTMYVGSYNRTCKIYRVN